MLETDKYAEYLSFTDYGNEEDYCRMVEKILSHSKFQSEAAKKMKNEIEESGAEAFFRNYQFVTLSTCRTMDGKDKRLMVIGLQKTIMPGCDILAITRRKILSSHGSSDFWLRKNKGGKILSIT